MREVYPQTNFIGGEISPKLHARIEVPSVQAGAKAIVNGIVVAQGGVMRRYGLQHVAPTKVAADRARLIPFVFNNEQAYMLEVGDGYARVYTQDGEQIQSGPSAYEFSLPHSIAQVLAMDYTQGGDTLFLLSETVFPQRLRRVADDNWVVGNAPFLTQPFSELGDYLATSLTLSSAAIGAVTVTASGATFFPSDVGRFISYAGGRLEITAYTSSTVVDGTVIDAFGGTAIPVDEWNLEGTPVVYCQPSSTGPAGETIQLTMSLGATGSPVAISTLSRVAESASMQTSTNHGLVAGSRFVVSGCTPLEWNGTYIVDTVPAADQLTFTIITDPTVCTGFGQIVEISFTGIGGWRTTDVGKYVEINAGLCQITSYTSSAVVDAEILVELASTVQSPPYAWVLKSHVWNARNGYPRTGTLHQQRLFLAGSTRFPLTVWGSLIAEYYDFLPGGLATDAVTWQVSADRFDPILHLSECGCLVALTGGAEYTFGAGSDMALGPTNPPKIDAQTNNGADTIAPERVGGELFFPQRGATRTRAMAADTYDPRKFSAGDMSALAEHLYRVGIVQQSYQKLPEPILHHVLADGRIAALSIDREQSLVATTQIVTDGEIEDVATLPITGGEQTWAIVKRTIDGAVVRSIERFVEGRHTDACVTGTSGPGSATWTAAHLPNTEVDVVADGVDMGVHTLNGAGSVTLPRLAYAVEIGLHYETYIDTLPPAVPQAQGAQTKIDRVVARFFETVGGSINGNPLPTRRLIPENLDSPLAPYTGDRDLSQLGWTRGVSSTRIAQTRPMPFHLTGLFYTVTVNG